MQQGIILPNARTIGIGTVSVLLAVLTGCMTQKQPVEKKSVTIPIERPITLADQHAHALAFSAIIASLNREPLTVLSEGPVSAEHRQSTLNFLADNGWNIKSREDLLENLAWIENGGHRKAFWELRERLKLMPIEKFTTELVREGQTKNDFYRLLIAAMSLRAPPRSTLEIIAWDFGRYINLCRWGYVGGYFSEQETWERIMPVARFLQASFASWDEFSSDYLRGREFWSITETEKNGDAMRDTAKFLAGTGQPWSKESWPLSLGDGPVAQDHFKATILRQPQNTREKVAAKAVDEPPALESYGPDALYFRALGKHTAKDADGALADIDQFLKQSPDSPKGLAARGTIWELKGNLSAAQADYDAAIALSPAGDPSAADAYLNRGRIRCQQGSYANSCADFTKAIELDPNFSEAYHNRALARVALRDLEGALADMDAAIKISPAARYFAQRGVIHLKSNEIDAAAKDYAQALELDQDNVDALLGRALLTVDSMPKQALKDANRAITLAPLLAYGYHVRALAYLGEKRESDALVDLSYSLDLNPNQTATYYHRGWIHLNHRDFAAAIEDFTQALTRDPYYMEAYRSRGTAKYAKGDFAGSYSDYTKAIAIGPQQATIYYDRGLVRRDLQDLDGSIADFDRAIELTPQYSEAYNARGFTKEAKGDVDGAIEDYSQAIALNPTFDLPYGNRARCLERKGRFISAELDENNSVHLRDLPKNQPPDFSR